MVADVFTQTAAVLATRTPSRWVSRSSADTRAGHDNRARHCGIIAMPGPAAGSAGALQLQQAPRPWHWWPSAPAYLALTLIALPGEIGADVAFSTAHAVSECQWGWRPPRATLSVHAKHARQLPGRLVGVSVDSDGTPAYRLALRTRSCCHARTRPVTSAPHRIAVGGACCTVRNYGAGGLIPSHAGVHARRGYRPLHWAMRWCATKYFDTVLAGCPVVPTRCWPGPRPGINLASSNADHVATCDKPPLTHPTWRSFWTRSV